MRFINMSEGYWGCEAAVDALLNAFNEPARCVICGHDTSGRGLFFPAVDGSVGVPTPPEGRRYAVVLPICASHTPCRQTRRAIERRVRVEWRRRPVVETLIEALAS